MIPFMCYQNVSDRKVYFMLSWVPYPKWSVLIVVTVDSVQYQIVIELASEDL